MIEFVFLVVKAVLFLAVGVGMVPFLIYFERKFAGFFQTRVGPTYAGPGGVLQSLGDMAKLLSKEDLTPAWAVGPSGSSLILTEEFGHVSERLENTARSRVGRTYASLEKSRKLALKVDEEWDHAHTNGEEQHGFDHQEDKFNHRSLSPSTTSTLPKMPTESASVSPSNSGGTAWQ